MLRTIALTMSCLVLSSACPTAQDDDVSLAPTVRVGDRAVKGKALRAFDSEWMSGETKIGEVTTIEKSGRDKHLVRVQKWPMQQGLVLETTFTCDASTLETVSIHQQITGLPEGASLGETPISTHWDFNGKAYTRTVQRAGAPEVTEGELAEPMFDGSALGLIIAALPLKKGYEARIPVAMSLNLSPEFTLYWARLRVVGSEKIEWTKGKSVKAWIVDVDWADYESMDITSVGGAANPGGAYYVVTKPPKGCPHVPRYVNDSTSIDLVLSE